MEKMGLIYMATCIITNKSYIGLTTRKLDIRVSEHKSFSKNNSHYYFYKAINKYGFENFEWKILEENIPIEMLNDKKKFYISLYEKDKLYNLNDGGGGVFGRIVSEFTGAHRTVICNIINNKKGCKSAKGYTFKKHSNE